MSYSSEQALRISLGSIYDPNGDSVTVSFDCFSTVFNDQVDADSAGKLMKEYISYDGDLKSITVREGIPAGVYKIELTMSELNELDPKSTTYFFDIKIIETTTEEEEPTDPNVEIDKEEGPKENLPGELPKFTLASLSFVGELTISFSQKMRLVQDLDQINTDSLALELILDQTSTSNEPGDLDFTWTVTEFEAR